MFLKAPVKKLLAVKRQVVNAVLRSERLEDLQNQFVNNLKAKRVSSIFLEEIQSDRLSALARFSIYQRNWWLGSLKALTRVYPVCQRLVGEKYFQKMTEDYIDRYPSISPTFYDYGAYLAEYLLETPFVKELPYLSDVARLEWAVHVVLLGPEPPLFDWQTLAEVSGNVQEKICFYRRPNSTLIYSSFPIDRIWETNQPEFRGKDEVDLAEGEVYLIVWRSEYDLRIDRLNRLQWSLLTHLDGNHALGQLPSLLGEKASEEIMQALPKLIQKGYITSFSL